jgi:PAS domain S-box-containing protein
MLWLYLLGAVTFLIIALRRVLRRQKPLKEALNSTKVAIEHVHSGVAFVQSDGIIGSVNQAMADFLAIKQAELVGREWYRLFPEADRVREAYTQMLLQGIASLDTTIERAGGTPEPVNVRLVTVNDAKMRIRGHHCLVDNLSREHALEAKVRDLTRELEEFRTTASRRAG